MILGIFENYAQMLEVIGVWLAAIATFSAAFVALRVADRQNRQNVKVVAQPMIEVTRGVPGSKEEIFWISATNLGTRSVTIRSLAIRSRWPRYDAILMEGLPGSSPLPITLKDGESGNWRYTENSTDGSNWYRGFAVHLQKKSRLIQWLTIRNIRFFVVTSLGGEFFAPASSGFREKVTQQIREVRNDQ